MCACVHVYMRVCVCAYVVCHHLPSSCVCVCVHSDFAAQISIEMPFDIKTVESPTHKIKMKVLADNRHFVKTINNVPCLFLFCFISLF